MSENLNKKNELEIAAYLLAICETYYRNKIDGNISNCSKIIENSTHNIFNSLVE